MGVPNEDTWIWKVVLHELEVMKQHQGAMNMHTVTPLAALLFLTEHITSGETR